MSYIPQQQQNTGVQLATTNVWDVTAVYQTDVNSPEFKELIVRLYQNINNVALAVNSKENSYYILEEFLNNQFYFSANVNNASDYRAVYRTVVDFGALPNAGVKSVPHGIPFDANYTLTRMYGAATDPVAFSYLPIPYASLVLANTIELNADAVNVNITTGINYSAYTRTVVVLEYMKQI